MYKVNHSNFGTGIHWPDLQNSRARKKFRIFDSLCKINLCNAVIAALSSLLADRSASVMPEQCRGGEVMEKQTEPVEIDAETFW